jgi:nucleotide-binding universal stress UspA family protein
MSCKTILVHLNDITRAERVLAAAIALARAHNAHLIGLAVIPPYVVTPAFDPTSVSMTIDTHRTAYMADVAKLKAMFNETCRREEVSCEWQQADALFGSAAACILERARSADLVVMPQDDAGWSYASLLDAAERVIIEAGRPVLLVPNNGRVALPAKRVLIAWNSRRESARATFDAIPLFSKGADVTVLWVDTASNPVMAADAPGANLCATLARHHGFKCEAASVHAPDGDAAEAIRREANARGADLVVMGAYGHSRFREYILGGATRDSLAWMDRPILMSH